MAYPEAGGHDQSMYVRHVVYVVYTRVAIAATKGAACHGAQAILAGCGEYELRL